MTHETTNHESGHARRAARRLRWLIEFGLILGGAALIALWSTRLGSHHLGPLTVNVTGPKSLAGHVYLDQLAESMELLALLYGLWRLRSLLRCFESGDFFGLAPVLHLRAFALTLVVVPALDVLLPPLIELGAHLGGIAGISSMSAEVDGSDVWFFLAGGIFYLIAWILTEARRAAEDSAQIV